MDVMECRLVLFGAYGYLSLIADEFHTRSTQLIG